MIEHLVVALDRRARSVQTLEDEMEIGQAKVAQAFLSSLAGCFFYAPPWTGLLPDEDLLRHVFGGLSYSKEVFTDLCLDLPKPKILSKNFIQAKRKHMKLVALIEGLDTRGVSLSLCVVKPLNSSCHRVLSIFGEYGKWRWRQCPCWMAYMPFMMFW